MATVIFNTVKTSHKKSKWQLLLPFLFASWEYEKEFPSWFSVMLTVKSSLMFRVIYHVDLYYVRGLFSVQREIEYTKRTKFLCRLFRKWPTYQISKYKLEDNFHCCRSVWSEVTRSFVLFSCILLLFKTSCFTGSDIYKDV